MNRTIKHKTLRPIAAAAASVALLAGASFSHAATYTWTGATTGTTDSANWHWNNAANWGGGGTPSAPGDVANLNPDVTGALTVRLNSSSVSVGTLNFGDSNASAGNYATTIQSNNSAYGITFESAAPGGMTYLNLTQSGTPNNVIASNVKVGGTSGLTITLGTNSANYQRLTTNTGTFDTNGNTVTLAGGVTGTDFGWSINGDLLGNGTIIQNNRGGINIGGMRTFTGTFVLNAPGPGSSNTGSLTVNGDGSIKNAGEVVLNGYVTRNGNFAVQNGGTLWAGNNSGAAVKPGQRFTQNTITLNGGSVYPFGQASNGSWSGAVTDTVNIVNFNSGFNYVNVNTNTTGNATAGTILDVGTVQRHGNAAMFLHNVNIGGTSKFLAGNGASLLVGAAGAPGTTTMSIIPWMGVGTGTYSLTPDSFATWESGTGFRKLATSELATSIAAGATANVNVGNFGALAADTTINSLRYTANNATNMGAGKTLTITSGGLMFTNNNGAIGAAGNAAAGTLNFGSAEGVVWTVYGNVNTIGAVVAGSGGLTKTGIGTVILAGQNTYTGKTYVGNSILQVGNGVQSSNLGITGDVAVAGGATLKLLNGDAIADSAVLTLEQAGLFNGLMFIDAGINETIGGLYLGGVAQIAGTYGSTSSGATFQNDTYFSGSGILTVVPEPGSLGLLALAGLLGMRRRRRVA